MSKYKIALFTACYGLPHFGGPTTRHYNIGRVLQKYNIDFRIFGFPTRQIHSDYALKEAVGGWPEDINDFNIFWVEQGFECVKKLNASDINPILGCNLIPNSGSRHVIPYLGEYGKFSQTQAIKHEKQWIQTLQGKFWCSQSYFQEKEYRRLGLAIDRPVYRIFNPVDINKFYPNSTASDKFTVIWIGKINWAKQPRLLEEIAQRMPHINFIYLSNDRTEFTFPSNVEKIIKYENQKMPELINRGHLYISTAVTENQPLGGLEAMACGLPVIAFRTSGWPEIVQDNYSGVLVDLANVDHMIYEIEKLRLDSERREYLGTNAREFVVKNFSFYACYQQYKKVFDKYLEKV